MITGGRSLSAVAALLVAAFVSWPSEAPAGEPDRRDPPAEVSGIRAAEAEKPPVLPTPRAVDLPILVYHHVVPGVVSGSSVMRSLFVTPDAFDQQLKYLKDNRYQSVSFDDLADCVEYGVPLPDRPVILSFDDGWENQFAYGFPLLQKYGFTATFFVVTGYLDYQNFMTTEQLKTMIAAGMTIGGHSRSHPALPTIGSSQRLQDEIAGSKSWLEERLGVPVTTFAYPYGSYTPAVVALIKAAGYRTARTVDDGTHATADNLETLPGIIFPAYTSHYRDKVEFAAGETRR
jgi:peptidoglycan/xylan/chitin deacetylase (PgdA/CDA1 family)